MQAHRVAGFGSLALGAAVATSAVVGPTLLKIVKFRTSHSVETQFIGGDIVSLALVAPVLIGAGALWLRNHRLAAAATIGPALYTAYTFVTVIGGQEYRRYPGNVEKFFPLYVSILGGAVALTFYSWSKLAEAGIPPPAQGLRRAFTWVFVGIGGFVALAWAAQIQAVMSGHPPADYESAPALFWLIKTLDFAFCIPALIATGVGLKRRSPLAARATVALAGFSTYLIASITGMAIAMQVRDDPSANSTMIFVLVPATVGLAYATWRYVAQPEVASRPGPAPVSRTSVRAANQ